MSAVRVLNVEKPQPYNFDFFGPRNQEKIYNIPGIRNTLVYVELTLLYILRFVELFYSCHDGVTCISLLSKIGPNI